MHDDDRYRSSSTLEIVEPHGHVHAYFNSISISTGVLHRIMIVLTPIGSLWFFVVLLMFLPDNDVGFVMCS
jgi:hypothetical protein